MASTRSVVLTGARELDTVLHGMAESLRRKSLRKALTSAGRIIIEKAKENLNANRSKTYRKRKTKRKVKGLAKSLRVRPSSQWPSRETMARRGMLGASIGFLWPDGAHAHLVEFGHRLVKGKNDARKGKKATVIGFVPPKPFFRPAVEATKGQVLKQFHAAVAEFVRSQSNKIKSK